MTDGDTNAIGRALALLGDEWTLLLAREALMGATRFSDFTALPISNAVLTARLQGMVRDGLLVREVYQQQPLRAGYVATAGCRALWPMLLSIWQWERTWVDHAAALPEMRHRDCGADFAPALRCAGCRAAVDSHDVTGRWGPSGGWRRSVPQAATRRRTGRDAAGLFPETTAIIGNRWSSAVLGAAFLGTRRFSDFQARLQAPTALIADRLRVFCRLGVLQAAAHPKRADWSEYHLTPKGRAFYPVVACAIDWAQAHLAAPDGPALLLTHGDHDFRPQLACDQCAEALRGSAVEVRARPGGAMAAEVPG